LFEPAELAYIANNYIYADHDQTLTGSAGISYLWQPTRFSSDLIYGSGLRNGFANTGTVPPYAQVNLGATHDFVLPASTGLGPLTLRFDVINLFDKFYEIRDGSGIGCSRRNTGRSGDFSRASPRSSEDPILCPALLVATRT
jgi:outer membrane receptor protein involved in Fe transport